MSTSREAMAPAPEERPAEDPNAGFPPSAPLWPTSAVETHVSTLWFWGDRVFKWKKPVQTGFLDFSTREAREAACRRELELNRRLAPDVYLGVADLLMEGVPLDHAVVMRRLPDHTRLTALVKSGADPRNQLRQVARVLAAFHATADRSAAIDEAGSPEAVAGLWEKNFEEMAPFVGRVLDPVTQASVVELARRYLAGRSPLLVARLADGRIVDGHGDLQAGDIFCLPDGPKILDCLEFDDRLRHGDVLADVAFLAMDLERLGAGEAAAGFLAAYQEFSADRFPASLANHYGAYRALVRAKVSCLSHFQGATWAAEAAANYHRLCLALLQRSRVRLVLVGGLPGTGKSTLAAALGTERGWVVLRSDEVRKEMAGIDPHDSAPGPWREGLYTEERMEATYQSLFERTAMLLGMGESVIADASFTNARWRELGQRVARDAAADLVELRCEAPFSETSRRLAARAGTGDPSDADAEVARAMSASADPWPSAFAIDTSTTPAQALAQAGAVLAADDVITPRPAPGARADGEDLG